MQNSVVHPRYADFVPLCVGENPGPRIQTSGFLLLWVHKPRSSPFYDFHRNLCKTVLDALNLLTLCHSVSDTILGPGIQSSGFHLLWVYKSRSIPFMSFRDVGHPGYANLVPLCIGEGPGPGIQS